MSKGGFSGKGIFATLAYLVVVFDGGREKAFQFKYEAQIDELLAVVRETYPDIPCVSAAAEKRIEEARIRRETERKNRPPMSEPAKKTVRALDRALDYLQQRPELAEHLSSAAKRRRNYQCTSGSYRWAAMAITLLGFAALAAMVVVVLMSYAQLTSISADVVSMQKELKTLDAEHVALLTQYERTFDLETVKAAAVAAGMNKPSSSQINYIDLSAPDSVELCEAQNVSVLSRVFTSLGQGVFSVVEYFS